MNRAVQIWLVLVLGLWAGQQTRAQQVYGETVTSYACTDTVNKSCSSFVIYRTRDVYKDIPSVANLFQANESEIARLNGKAITDTLYTTEPLIVPVSCSCVNASSMALINYVIRKGDTFYLLSNNTLESLASTQAIIDANAEQDPTTLQIGQVINIPIRCACPTSAQIANGTQTLMTYTVLGGETVGWLAAFFDVPGSEIRAANSLQTDELLYAQRTLVIPYKVSQPIIRAQPPPPPPPAAVPEPQGAITPTPPSSSSSSSTNAGVYVGIGVGVCAAIVIAAAICAYLVIARKRRRTRTSHGKNSTPLAAISARTDTTSPPYSSDLTPRQQQRLATQGDPLEGMFDVMDKDRPTLFSFDEIKEATNNFAFGNRIQGSVYRGILRNEVVAIKQMRGDMSQELKILCKVHHTNLVKLVGLCVTDAEHMYLVYEYAENGSLSDCLHTDFLSKNKMATKSSSFLGWTVRLQIALDVATGLEYIHDYIKPNYVHKDVKSSNILLDGAFRAKIANFAMAKSGGTNPSMMTRHIAGTYGYMAPEYLAHGQVTLKADVFAFGVTLLELLSGKEALLEEESGQEKCLYSSIGPLLEGDDMAVKTKLKDWIDPALQSHYPLDTAQQLAYLARSCVENDPAQRPGMKDITYALSNLLAVSLEWESSAVFAHTLLDTPIEAR
ncbi:protein MpRLK-Pelle_LysM5 [Marchantia polymorpha subsp. ruderalis]|uniref:Uncharacterized protein n=1 Tax=Marchantia polymorpha TaxID=3197 RepID=A0A2R6XMD3_MARPO|nr:hypothetical protein MARPO_0008s0038 [Marchantia polymorpha]BBN19572.1 hypothetical protein Mp_8g11780 [Marchantia polymorpha subsp. ruderalis]|eukprot:PTQ47252.1 hypothetical protein MARPO_0008s0038 [Marchantia polymorpha]